MEKRRSVSNLPTGPKDVKSTVLTIEEEAIIVAFRRHTLLPLDDCLYALKATIPHLTRSARRLKPLRGLTPYEYICKTWETEPERFRLNPHHQMPGLNI